MNRKLWIQKALSTCSLAAVIATSSMAILASPAMVGELTVSGRAADSTFVTVNGETAESGRTISASSTIVTPDGMSAVVNFGKNGKLQFGPNTTFAINGGDNGLGGELTAGSVTVLNASKAVAVRMTGGEVVTLNAGETATAGATSSTKAARGASSGDWWIYALVVGGAIGGIIWAASADNENRFGSGAVTVSPIR